MTGISPQVKITLAAPEGGDPTQEMMSMVSLSGRSDRDIIRLFRSIRNNPETPDEIRTLFEDVDLSEASRDDLERLLLRSGAVIAIDPYAMEDMFALELERRRLWASVAGDRGPITVGLSVDLRSLIRGSLSGVPLVNIPPERIAKLLHEIPLLGEILDIFTGHDQFERARRARMGMAREDVAEQEAMNEELANSRRVDIRMARETYFIAQAQTQYADRRVRNLEEQIAFVRERFNVGQATREQVVNLKSALDFSRRQRRETQVRYEMAQFTLLVLGFNINPDTMELQVTGEEDEREIAFGLLGQAALDNPLVQAARARREGALAYAQYQEAQQALMQGFTTLGFEPYQSQVPLRTIYGTSFNLSRLYEPNYAARAAQQGVYEREANVQEAIDLANRQLTEAYFRCYWAQIMAQARQNEAKGILDTEL